MNGKSPRRLLFVIPLVLLFGVGIVVPLHAESLPFSVVFAGENDIRLEITTPTLSADNHFAFTVIIQSGQPVTVANARLVVGLPEGWQADAGVVLDTKLGLLPPDEVPYPYLVTGVVQGEVGATALITAEFQGSVAGQPFTSVVAQVSVPPFAELPAESPGDASPEVATEEVPSVTPSPSPAPPTVPPELTVPAEADVVETVVPSEEPLPSPISGFDFPSWVRQYGFPLLLIGALLLIAVVLFLVLLIRRPKRARRQSKRPQRPPTDTRPIGETPPVPTRAFLTLAEAVQGTPIFPLEAQGVTLGRVPENDLVIGQQIPGWETVSRHHARIYRQDRYWIVEDLDSHNGVYVNGQRTGRNLLQDGCQVRLGGVAFTFHAGTEEVAS